MRRLTKALLMQLPMMIFLVTIFVGFIYAAIVDPRITFWHGVPVWIIILLYFWGRVIEIGERSPHH